MLLENKIAVIYGAGGAIGGAAEAAQVDALDEPVVDRDPQAASPAGHNQSRVPGASPHGAGRLQIDWPVLCP